MKIIFSETQFIYYLSISYLPIPFLDSYYKTRLENCIQTLEDFCDNFLIQFPNSEHICNERNYFFLWFIYHS